MKTKKRRTKTPRIAPEDLPKVRTGDLVVIGQGWDYVYVVTENPDSRGRIWAKRYDESLDRTSEVERQLYSYRALGRRSAFGRETDRIHARLAALDPQNLRNEVEALKQRILQIMRGDIPTHRLNTIAERHFKLRD